MRSLIRLYLTGAIALYVTTRLVPGFIIEGSLVDFALVAVIFTGVQMIVRPLISLMLLPFHFLTLGSVAWIVNLLTLYVLTFFIAKVKIVGFPFDGYSTAYFVIPQAYITPFIAAMIASLSLGIIGATIHWVME